MLTRISIRFGLAVALAGAGCGNGPSGPDDGTLTILFIGNSLTASNNLPGITQEVAVAGGALVAYEVTAPGGVGLEDHWNAGVEDLIEDVRADVVVMQQGPSSLPDNQVNLRVWAERLAGPIRRAGGVPALLMVWPERARLNAFDAVRDAYRGAAEAVDGIFIPAGEAWRAAWSRDSTLALYSFDDFHPSCLGSFVAALTVYAALVDPDLTALGADAVSGVPPALMTVLLDAVREVTAGGDPVTLPGSIPNAVTAGSEGPAQRIALPCTLGS